MEFATALENSSLSVTRNRRLTVNERAAFYTVVGAIAAAVLAAVAGIYKTWRESSLAAKNAELSELRLYRQELKEEMAHLRARQNDLEDKLSRATAQIQEQRGYFAGILFKLEGILALQDATLIAGHLQNIVSHLRQILDMPIGEPERRIRVIEEEKKND